MIFRSFESRNPKLLCALFNTYVRPILEYASPVWSPHLKLDILRIEKIQRSFSKRIPCLRNLSYDERLAALGSISLHKRRLYLDLVFMYKILHGGSVLNINTLGISSTCSKDSLRNYGFNLNACVSNSSLNLHSFAYGTCKIWNMLPKNVNTLSLREFKKLVINMDLVKLAMGRY